MSHEAVGLIPLKPVKIPRFLESFYHHWFRSKWLIPFFLDGLPLLVTAEMEVIVYFGNVSTVGIYGAFAKETGHGNSFACTSLKGGVADG